MRTRGAFTDRTEEHDVCVRDLDLWGQPSFLVYQPPMHKCSRCGHRQQQETPFKRPNVTYSYRFEREVLRSLIGSTEGDLARRFGISAATVRRIVENQLGDGERIDPGRTITDIGLDEISLKKRHKLYVTILTDMSDPDHPQVPAVARGKDCAAAEAVRYTVDRIHELMHGIKETFRGYYT